VGLESIDGGDVVLLPFSLVPHEMVGETGEEGSSAAKADFARQLLREGYSENRVKALLYAFDRPLGGNGKVRN
jgi:hypothetical protein